MARLSLLLNALLAIALNCHPVSVVTNDEIHTTAAMAFKYGEESTTRILPWISFVPVPARAAEDWFDSSGPNLFFGHTTYIRTAESTRNGTIPRRRLSVPNARAADLEMKPAKIQPRIAPPPTIPKIRLASRVVRR